MIPLVITAQLGAGFSSADPYSPAIDGILAYWFLREQMGEEQFVLNCASDQNMVPAEGLPLGVERHGEHWWYQCSSPLYDIAAQHRSYYHRRFDETLAAKYLPAGTKKVLTAAGPYKGSRLHETIRITRSVTWHAIGDAVEIRRLLDRCSYIGRGGARGRGVVTDWLIEPGGDEALARHHRPLPVEYAHACGIGGPLLAWGFRPPGRIAANIHPCIMPDPPYAV